jgi:hypothetical protein
MPTLSASAQSRMSPSGIPRAVDGSFAGKTENAPTTVSVTLYGGTARTYRLHGGTSEVMKLYGGTSRTLRTH